MKLDNISLTEVWEQISIKAKEENDLVPKDIHASYLFHIDDTSYSLIFENGETEVVHGTIESPNCELTMNEKNFKRLLTGDLNATSAFMTGRLRVKGNIGDALKLEQILRKYKF